MPEFGQHRDGPVPSLWVLPPARVPDPAFRLSWVRVGLTGQRRFLSPVLTRVQLSARRDRRGTGVCRHQL